MKHTTDFLRKEEVDAIIQTIKQPTVRHMIVTMATTGLRVSECIQLEIDDVDFSKNEIHVRNGKGGKERCVPMSESTAKQLAVYWEKYRPQTASSYFFATKRSGTISTQYINRLLHQAAKQVGIQKRVSSHDMRRAFASHLSHHNVNVKTIQMLLGHENLKTTSVYIFQPEEAMADAVSNVPF